MRNALEGDEMPSTGSLCAAAASVVAMLVGLARLAGKQRLDGEARVAGVAVIAGFVGYTAVLWMN
jgi:hypothetical protein